MDMVYKTEQKISIAIYYNVLIDYLEGVGVFKICSDPRDRQSLHAFNFSMECYNKYAAKCPQLELDKRFSEELISRLKSINVMFMRFIIFLTASLPNKIGKEWYCIVCGRKIQT